MDDRDDRKYEPEAPTLVPGGGASAPHPPAPVRPATGSPGSAPSAGNDFATIVPPGRRDMATGVISTPPTMVPSGAAGTPPPASTWGGLLLAPGTLLNNRYEIVRILGEGGMGAVYEARDLELERAIALKVIRPELASDPHILQRFKQELVLARQVSDRNVIRIFDLGEADRVKFITMEYVEGESLHHILRERGKLGPAEAVDIMEQVASGLAAVHREGIIHRDLKPGNIMRDSNGRVVVMDFGLARTLQGDGMTRSGAMLGTIEYMSPEQAHGTELTPSSDIFTVGLILYECLAGVMPFKADSAIASLLKRTQERAAPLSDHDKKIPTPLANIVAKCLEKDPAHRYQNADALVADLRAWQGKGGATKVSASSARVRIRRVKEMPWLQIAGAAVIMIATVVGLSYYITRRYQPRKVATHTPVSVLVADFQNQTGDSLFNDTLEPMFNVALEGASFIDAFNRGTARQAAAALPTHSNTLDENTARLVAVKEGIAAIVTGSLSKAGNGYSLSVHAVDAMSGKTLASATATTPDSDKLLLEVPRLAVSIRQALGDTTPKSVQLAATEGTFSATNLDALHQYSMGVEEQFQGKWTDALRSFSKAAELDPNFARAWAAMAAAAGNLGQMQDAEKYAKTAMEHVDRMTERERYRVRGLYYIWTENWQKCVEENTQLVRAYPADNVGHNNLAGCYARMLDMPEAMEQARQGLQITPRDVMAGMNFALYSCYATNFQSCEQGARHVLEINPAYEEAYLVLAYSQIGQDQLDKATETYQKLEKMSPWGASLAASGLGDLALYRGDFRQAADILEKGAAQDKAGQKPDVAADKLLMVAYAELQAGHKQPAVSAAERALALSQSAKVRFLAARIFATAGAIEKAQKLAAGLTGEIQNSAQAYARIIDGDIALSQHMPNQAIQRFTEANRLANTWLGHFDMGRAYLDASAWAEADSEFDQCIKGRGEVLELFMDDVPTYSYLPVVYYDQGRDREGLRSPGFTKFYETYLSIRGKSTEDPLLAEIRTRLSHANP